MTGSGETVAIVHPGKAGDLGEAADRLASWARRRTDAHLVPHHG
jgi:hypothetical protein